jgi:hypothetical protein
MLALGIVRLAGGVALDVLAPHLGHGAAIAVVVLSAVVFVAFVRAYLTNAAKLRLIMAAASQAE